MNAIERARAYLAGDVTLAVAGERDYTFTERGVNALCNLAESSPELLRGAAVADKIVGKAAALLMALGGVKQVYAEVMSRSAQQVFEKYNIPCDRGQVAETIKNRAGTGQCPMEQTVRHIDDPAAALKAIRRTQRVLRVRAQGGYEMKKLGFGMMRLPITGGDQKNIDYDTVKRMVDTFLERGFDYFDTAWMYHAYASEIAVRECLVKRYPRESFRLASKLPVFMLTSREDRQKIFDRQLEKCGVEYFDNYLLHNINSGDIDAVEKYDCFGFARSLKAQGKIKRYGFSFHDTPELLDKVLTEHPDAEFVQLQINYLDWKSEGVQSERLWQVARKHGKPIIVMEPVKGGTLADVPEKAAGLLKAARPDMSIPSWAIRFAAGLDGVETVLSGMSDMAQLEDNTSFMQNFEPLSEEELKVVRQAAAVIRGTGAIACTACRYCTENCPKNIAIPDYFSLYNLELIENGDSSKDWTTQQNYYENYTRTHGKASDCIKCGACERHCPQHLPIRDLLVKVAEKFE
ncbi:MAG TPA: DUF1893 domain-containing protein [Candidatus Coproplasma excrementavium]|nr:DUF1893 domain-containing protein [Candidatus Coproplasma excrementavium]